MKKTPLLLSIVSLLGVLAALPAAAQELYTQKLEPNVQITLPKAQQLRAFPMPIPGASNYRIETGTMRIGLTGIPRNLGGGEPPPVPPDEELKELALEIAAQARLEAANPDAQPVQYKGPGWTATYVTYSAKPGSAGFVAMGRAFQCVSSGQITTVRTVFVVTIGSSDCSGAEHQGFLKALETLSVDG